MPTKDVEVARRDAPLDMSASDVSHGRSRSGRQDRRLAGNSFPTDR